MNRNLLFPILMLGLTVLACGLTSGGTPSATPSEVGLAATGTNTPFLPMPSPTPLPLATLGLTPTSSPLTMDLLRGSTYFAPAYQRTVRLVNGSFSDNSSSGPYSVQMLDVQAFGDLNADGVDDAAVLLVENNGGSGQFESVVAVLNSGGIPYPVGQAVLGDRVKINSMQIASGEITLDMLVQGPNDAMCCPSQSEAQTYQLVGGALWLRHLVSRTPAGSERVIAITAPQSGGTVSSPFTLSGNVTIAPFENTLAFRIFFPDGEKINESTLKVTSAAPGGPGTFDLPIDLSQAGVTGTLILQVLDLSAADGSTLAMDSLVLTVK